MVLLVIFGKTLSRRWIGSKTIVSWLNVKSIMPSHQQPSYKFCLRQTTHFLRFMWLSLSILLYALNLQYQKCQYSLNVYQRVPTGLTEVIWLRHLPHKRHKYVFILCSLWLRWKLSQNVEQGQIYSSQPMNNNWRWFHQPHEKMSTSPNSFLLKRQHIKVQHDIIDNSICIWLQHSQPESRLAADTKWRSLRKVLSRPLLLPG